MDNIIKKCYLYHSFSTKCCMEEEMDQINTHSENISSDRRSLRTKKAIKKALIILMSKKNISEITIKEVSEIADINRKTFYAHYADVYQVFGEIENDLINKMLNIIDSTNILSNHYDPFPIFRELTDEINSDPEYYKYLIQASAYGKLQGKIKQVFRIRLLELHKNDLPANIEVLSFVLDFVAAGIASVYQDWFNSEQRLTLEELSEMISKLVSNGIYAVLEPVKE